jgi:adenylate cyclase class 2
MNKEIELKAGISEPEVLKKVLIGKYGDFTAINKDDIYYRYPSSQLVRLRRENNTNCITVKKKKLINGIEVNDELEFNVDDGGGFLSFLNLTGAEEYLSKVKRGYRFTSSAGVVIELCEVSTLGWFIEIEKVISIPEEYTGTEVETELIEDAKKIILGILSSIGIPESQLEHRYYSELLLGKKSV